MALVRAYRIRCDRCHWAGPSWRDSSAEARRLARGRGWRRTPKKDGDPGRDLCARCAGESGHSTEPGPPPNVAWPVSGEPHDPGSYCEVCRGYRDDPHDCPAGHSTEDGAACTGICGREPEGEHAHDCPNREA